MKPEINYPGTNAAAEAVQRHCETRRLKSELVEGVTGRIVIHAPPVPGSRAAIEAEHLRAAGAKFDAEIAAIDTNPLPDLAELLRKPDA